MKLIGNSVAVPVIEKLVTAIMETGVFSMGYAKHSQILDCDSETVEYNRNYQQMSLFEA